MFLGLGLALPRGGIVGPWGGYSSALAALLTEAQTSGLVLDFTQNIAFRAGTSSTITGVSGWTYTRSGTAYDLAGTTSFAANTLRRTSAGLLCEPGATNLFLNSDVGATQSITLTAVQHVLSFQGTGSITLSGTATGTLNGTGANQFVSLAFTPTAGSVTFTVTGSVTFVQVEISTSGFRSSYIPTAGTSASRGTDVPVITGLPFSGAHSVIALTGTKNTPTFGRVFLLSDGTVSNRTIIDTADGVNARLVSISAGVTTAGNFGAWSTGAQRMAIRNQVGDTRGAVAGTLGTAIAPAALPVGTLGTLDFSSSSMNGLLQIIAILPRAMSDAELQAATA